MQEEARISKLSIYFMPILLTTYGFSWRKLLFGPWSLQQASLISWPLSFWNFHSEKRRSPVVGNQNQPGLLLGCLVWTKQLSWTTPLTVSSKTTVPFDRFLDLVLFTTLYWWNVCSVHSFKYYILSLIQWKSLISVTKKRILHPFNSCYYVMFL